MYRSHPTSQNFAKLRPDSIPKEVKSVELAGLGLPLVGKSPLRSHQRDGTLFPRAPPGSSGPRPLAARVGGGAGGEAGGLGAGRGGPRSRAGDLRGPARCRCCRPERLQLQRCRRRQRGREGGLRAGPARSRDYGGTERPLQDRGGGGRGVRQDGAAAGVRQGRLPRGEGPASWEGDC